MTSIYKQVHDLFAASHWTQGKYCVKQDIGADAKTCYCLVGAFEHFSGADPHSRDMASILEPVVTNLPREHVNDYVECYGRYYPPEVIDAAKQGLPTGSSALNHDLVVAWNDKEGRTKDEVLDVLAKADAAAGESA